MFQRVFQCVCMCVCLCGVFVFVCLCASVCEREDVRVSYFMRRSHVSFAHTGRPSSQTFHPDMTSFTISHSCFDVQVRQCVR